MSSCAGCHGATTIHHTSCAGSAPSTIDHRAERRKHQKKKESLRRERRLTPMPTNREHRERRMRLKQSCSCTRALPVCHHSWRFDHCGSARRGSGASVRVCEQGGERSALFGQRLVLVAPLALRGSGAGHWHPVGALQQVRLGDYVARYSPCGNADAPPPRAPPPLSSPRSAATPSLSE